MKGMKNTEPDSLIEARLDRPAFRLEIALGWDARALVLFGASGAGKTTLFRILLGLEPDATVRFRLRGEWLEDPTKGIRTPVHRRRLGWLPQDPLLFPDRNVEENIRFGVGRGSESSWTERAIDVLELAPLLDRDVRHLSGGERQRIALARAIAIRPRALLLDEPMASLDVALRARILPYLSRIRDELDLPFIYITHDPDEAILFGDEIAVLEKGRVVDRGNPREVLWSRAAHALPDQLGVENLLEVSVSPGNATGFPASTRVRTKGGLDLEAPWPIAPGEDPVLGIRAEEILLSLDEPKRISARNVHQGRVARIDREAEDAWVHVDVEAEPDVRDGETAKHRVERLIAKLTGAAVRDLSLEPGMRVHLIIKSQALRRVR
ncbi:MAG TPA: ATP-binding cassette domain-containing protein [Deltaproteobacteria bacterium]|nr:ATP-binding cassette domain-containing protein [Deltaproteobacteria bacterium]